MCLKRMIPKVMAPRISKIVAKMHACRRETTLDPTEVPKELATSLAPTAKDRMKAMMKATIRIHKTCEENALNVDSLII